MQFRFLDLLKKKGISNDNIGVKISAHSDLILHILNKKRSELNEIEAKYNISIDFVNDNSIIPPQKKLEVIKNNSLTNQETQEIKTDSTSNNEDENENKNKKGKRLNRRKKELLNKIGMLLTLLLKKKIKFKIFLRKRKKRNLEPKLKKQQ